MLDFDVDQLVQDMDQETLIGALSALGLLTFFARRAWQRLKTPRKDNRDNATGWELNRPILAWSDTEALTIGDAFEGIFICGATGSGKSSTSVRYIAEGLLRARAGRLGGPGALISTVKPDDPEFWIELARNIGRSEDLVILGPGQGFNFIRYESERCGTDLVENSADLLAIGCDIGQRGATHGGGGHEGYFWKNARQQLLRNAIVALDIAYGGASVPALFAFVSSIPTSEKQATSKFWRQTSFCSQTFAEALKNCRPEQEDDLSTSFRYCTQQLPTAGDETQGNVLLTLTSMADVLARGLAKQMLCGETTVTPEDVQRGKIVILNVPTATYGLTGRLIQGIIRYCFQRAMLRRNVRENPRPVLFLQDECQAVISSYDAEWLSLCRSSRCANIYATQNLGNMVAACGGERGEAETHSILGNLNLKIMHANGCTKTNEWAAKSIGQSIRPKFSANNSYQAADVLSDVFGFGPGPTTSAGYSEELQFEVLPSEFTRLMTGGPRNNRIVNAIAFQSGHVFSDTGSTWRRVTFEQKK